MLVKNIYLIILFFFLQDVIELIVWFCDDHLKKEFFSLNGLAQFGWCEKYMLYSDFSVKLPSRLKTPVVQFIWFRSLYRHKLCPCFICESFKSKYDC